MFCSKSLSQSPPLHFLYLIFLGGFLQQDLWLTNFTPRFPQLKDR